MLTFRCPLNLTHRPKYYSTPNVVFHKAFTDRPDNGISRWCNRRGFIRTVKANDYFRLCQPGLAVGLCNLIANGGIRERVGPKTLTHPAISDYKLATQIQNCAMAVRCEDAIWSHGFVRL